MELKVGNTAMQLTDCRTVQQAINPGQRSSVSATTTQLTDWCTVQHRNAWGPVWNLSASGSSLMHTGYAGIRNVKPHEHQRTSDFFHLVTLLLPSRSCKGPAFWNRPSAPNKGLKNQWTTPLWHPKRAFFKVFFSLSLVLLCPLQESQLTVPG